MVHSHHTTHLLPWLGVASLLVGGIHHKYMGMTAFGLILGAYLIPFPYSMLASC